MVKYAQAYELGFRDGLKRLRPIGIIFELAKDAYNNGYMAGSMYSFKAMWKSLD